MTVESIGFTQEDFDVMRKALETLPIVQQESPFGGLSEIFSNMSPQGMYEGYDAHRKKLDDLKQSREKKAKTLKDQIIVAQYKLLQFEKYINQPVPEPGTGEEDLSASPTGSAD